MLCNPNGTDLCDFIGALEPTLIFVLLHIMYIPIILIILISIFGKENEDDTTWFVLNNAIINLIVCIVSEFINLIPIGSFTKIFYDISGASVELSMCSIFPLAFTRFLYLYFRDFYERFLKKKILVLCILGYDLFLIIILSFVIHFQIYLALFTVFIISLAGTFIFSFLIFLKIRQMMKLVGHNSQHNTLNNLRRAAFVCLIQASLASFYFAMNFYIFFYEFLYSDIERLPYGFLYSLYIIFFILKYDIYHLVAIIDTFIILFMLTSYRNGFKKIYIFMKNFLENKRKKSNITILVSSNKNIRAYK